MDHNPSFFEGTGLQYAVFGCVKDCPLLINKSLTVLADFYNKK
jgi:hypothetical protein